MPYTNTDDEIHDHTDQFVYEVYEAATEAWYASLSYANKIFPADEESADEAARLSLLVRLTQMACEPVFCRWNIDPILAMYTVLEQWQSELDNPPSLDEIDTYSLPDDDRTFVSWFGLIRMGLGHAQIEPQVETPDGDLYDVDAVRIFMLK